MSCFTHVIARKIQIKQESYDKFSRRCSTRWGADQRERKHSENVRNTCEASSSNFNISVIINVIAESRDERFVEETTGAVQFSWESSNKFGFSIEARKQKVHLHNVSFLDRSYEPANVSHKKPFLDVCHKSSWYVAVCSIILTICYQIIYSIRSAFVSEQKVIYKISSQKVNTRGHNRRWRA